MPGRHTTFIKPSAVVTLMALASLVLYPSSPAHAEPLKAGQTRIGVILLQAGNKPSQLAEATAVKLLSNMDAQPVERAELDKVLKEQSLSLSSMSDPATALAVGRALRADAVLILEPLDKLYLRCRVMDTQHGVILTESLLVTEQPDSFDEGLRPVLERALQKVRIPAQQVVYVSVLGVTASVDDQRLRATASQLGPLIQADLQSVPRVRVVERDQLAQIRRENALAGGKASIYGSAVVIEGELGPADNGRKADLSLLVTNLKTGKTTPLQVKQAQPAPSVLRELARGMIAEHLALVESGTAARAGSPEAAAIMARAHWRVMHDDFDGAEGRVEAALLIDDSIQRLEEARSVYYQIDASSGLGTPPLAAGRSIQAVRRRHELLLQRLRLPSQAGELDSIGNVYPIHLEYAMASAESDQDKAAIADIFRIADELYDLAMAYRRAHEEGVFDLLGNRLWHLPLVSASAQAYIQRSRALIGQMRQEMAKGDPWWGNPWEFDPVVGAIGSQTDYWESDHYDPIAPTRFGAKQARPLFDWMLEQDDRGLWIAAYRFRLKFDPPARREASAQRLLKLIYEDAGPDRPKWGCSGFWPENCYDGVASEATDYLKKIGKLGEWIDHFMNRMQAAGSIKPLIRAQPKDFIDLIEYGAGDGRAMRTERIDRLMKLLEGIELEDEDQQLHLSSFRAFGAQLQEKIADKKRTHDNPWHAYDIQLVKVRGQTDDMLDPSRYLITGNRGDENRQLYISWDVSDYRGHLFTRCPLQGGELQMIGLIKDYALNMAVCRGRLVAGGLKGVYVLSEEGGPAKWYGTQQGLPGEIIDSLAVVGDRVIVGCRNGLAVLDPVTGNLEVIANALALEAKSPLDRVPPYSVTKIMTLDGYNRFWFLIDGNKAGKLRGLWWHDLDTGKTRKVPNIKTTAHNSHPRTYAWKHRGRIVAFDDLHRGFFRLDPDTNQLLPLDEPAYRKEWDGHFWDAPVIVGDHLFLADAMKGYIYDAQGREFPRSIPKAWKYAVELSDDSVFLGYSAYIRDTGGPAMWILKRKVAAP